MKGGDGLEFWRVCELGIDFGAPAVLALAGLCVVYWVGLRKWRRKAARRCFKCGYDMRGSSGLVCVECGWEARSQKEVEHGRVLKGVIGLGAVLCVPAVALAVFWMVEAPRAMRRSALVDRYIDWGSGITGKVELGVESNRRPFFEERDQEWRERFIRWIAEDEKFGFCGNGVMDAFAEHVSPSLDPGSFVSPSSREPWRQGLVYAAHAALYPVDHYRSYYPNSYAPVVGVWKRQDDGERMEIPQDVLEVLRQFEECEEVDVMDLWVDDRAMKTLGKMRGLRNVRLQGVTSSSGGIGLLSGIDGIEKFDITFEREVTGADFEAMGKLVTLKGLLVRAPKGVRPGSSEALARMIRGLKLEEMELDLPCEMGEEVRGAIADGHFKKLQVDVTGWTAAEIARLGRMKSLEFLDINRDGSQAVQGESDLAWLRELPRLKELKVWGFKGESIRVLGELKCVERLTLGGKQDEARLLELVGRVRVAELRLLSTGLSQAALSRISLSPALKALTVDDWVMDENAASRLAMNAALQELRVQDMTERGLEAMLSATAKRYVMIYLTKCRLPKKTVENLEAKYSHRVVADYVSEENK